MSMNEISEVELSPQELFDHSKVLEKEIDRFRKNFEENQRYKEFDGLIKRNHRIYEAIDTNLLPALQTNNCDEFVQKMDKLISRINRLTEMKFRNDHFHGIDLCSLTASDIAKLAEAAIRSPPLPQHMATIVECDSPRVSADDVVDLN
jgi:hypothetical protein